MKTKCTASTKTNQPCRAWAVRPAKHSKDGTVRGSHPPRCAAHSAAATPSTPPPALDDVFVTPDDVVAALVDGQSRLPNQSPIPNPEFPALSPFGRHGRLLDIYTPIVSRLLRAARAQDRRGPTPAQELDRAIDRVLDELSQSGELEL